MPKVTVLMSVYNAQRYLREAIDSILRQTWTDYEFLIINDGSTDNSREIITSFGDSRIRVMDNPTNIGLTKSLNRGLELAQGEFIARQDADDISHATRLEQQVQFLDAHPQVVLLGINARAIDETGKPNILLRVPIGLLAIRWYLMFENAFWHSSVIFRRNVIWEKLGGYNESFIRSQDYELWSRVARTFLVENLPDVLIDQRFHNEAITSLSPMPTGPLVEDLIHGNLKAFLQSPDVPASWAHLITCFRRKDEFSQRRDWDQVTEMYEQIWVRYCQLHPEAELDPTIRSHLAGILYWTAYWSAPRNRRVSLQAYASARKLAPKSDRHPPLIKYVALWSIGERIRRAYHRFSHQL